MEADPVSTHTITIEDWHPTPLNKLLNAHWAKAAQMKKKDKRIIAYSCLYHKIPKATGKRQVELTIVLGKGQRACDPDAYWKVVLDGLKPCGMLKDDSRQWVELLPVIFERDKKRTIIRLTDID